MQRLVQIAKILSDINKVKIIALMQREKELCVCEICDTLALSQPLVSRHLKMMREAELVKTKQSGKWMIYSLTQNKMLNCLLEDLQEEFATLPKVVACSRC